MEVAKIEKQKRICLNRKLFTSREHSHKVEKAFVRNLEEFSYGINESTASCVAGACGLLASNYYHPNGHTMPFLIGLEYATYRYLNIPITYNLKSNKVQTPAECSACGVDFTVSWSEVDGKLLCDSCARIPIKLEVNKRIRKNLKRSIVDCYIKEHKKIASVFDSKIHTAKNAEQVEDKIDDSRRETKENCNDSEHSSVSILNDSTKDDNSAMKETMNIEPRTEAITDISSVLDQLFEDNDKEGSE